MDMNLPPNSFVHSDCIFLFFPEVSVARSSSVEEKRCGGEFSCLEELLLELGHIETSLFPGCSAVGYGWLVREVPEFMGHDMQTHH